MLQYLPKHSDTWTPFSCYQKNSIFIIKFEKVGLPIYNKDSDML